MGEQEFVALYKEWEGIQFMLDQGGFEGKEDYIEATDRQVEIERLMEAAPWCYDDEGHLIPKEPTNAGGPQV